MQLPYHNLVAWQRADDLFITMHLLSRYISSLTSDTSWGLSWGARLYRSARTSWKAMGVEPIEIECISWGLRPRRWLRSATTSMLPGGLATSRILRTRSSNRGPAS